VGVHGLSEDCDHADSGTGNAKVNRRLAAILTADIALYRALMGADEARTVRDLKGHQTVVRPMIADYGGRVIDTAGILAELGSVVKRSPVRDRHPGDDGQAQRRNRGASTMGRSRRDCTTASMASR
jgi:class 3 adenylate cyclase